MDNKRMRHAVYNLTYHFVWTPKYRRAVLEGAVADRLVALLRELVPALGGELVELVVRPDHVHLFGHFPPTLAPYQIAHRLKGATSHALREEFPALKGRLPSLWTHSYHVGAAGIASSETVRKYIEAQKGLSMLKSYKYRAYPTRAQAAAMATMVDTHRRLYNRALAERKDAWEQEQRAVSYGDQSATLRVQRATNPYLAATNFSSCQATLRRLERAFLASFRRVKAGEKPGHPRFRGAGATTPSSSPPTVTAASCATAAPTSSTSARSS